jgi:uncharacterized protein (DUF58 family)
MAGELRLLSGVIFDEEFLRKLEALRLAVRRAVSGRREGERNTRRRGGAAEFASHRSYAQGDEFRRIDWNLYGRLGQLYVKEFTREAALQVRLCIDTTPSMAPKFDFARRLGAVLGLVARQEMPDLPLARIESLRLGEPFAVPPETRGLVIVVTDGWDDALRVDLARVRAEAALVHVLSPEELDPPLSGKVRLVDAETGESRVRFIGEEERARYRELLAEHCADWKRWCFDREINYLRCAGDAPLEEVAQVYLREAGILE